MLFVRVERYKQEKNFEAIENAAHGGFFFTTPAKPFMGKNCDLHRNCNVPLVTHREF